MKVHCKKLKSESKHKKCPKIICRKKSLISYFYKLSSKITKLDKKNELEEFIKILADDQMRLQYH